MNFHRSYFLSGETIFLWKHCSQYSINRVCALLLNVSPLAHTCAYYDLVMRKHKKWPHHDWIFFNRSGKVIAVAHYQPKGNLPGQLPQAVIISLMCFWQIYLRTVNGHFLSPFYMSPLLHKPASSSPKSSTWKPVLLLSQ